MPKQKNTKSKKDPRPRGWLTTREQVDAWYAEGTQALMAKDYEAAISIARRMLRYLPVKSTERGEAYALMGNAHAMQQRFEESYQALSKAIESAPTNPYHWFNRSISCRFLFRSGQALRDVERAIELEGDGKMAKSFKKELAFAQKLVRMDLALRGPGFTIEQLIEQQDWFQNGVQAAENREWEKAVQIYERSIEMGDCLPQPHGNRGMCLMMLGRFDEAELALKRALELDADYEFARRNLEILQEVRETGELPLFGGTQSPFDGKKLKSGINFVPDDSGSD